MSRTECAVQDGAKQVGLPGAVEGATCHPASRRRAKPLQVPHQPSTARTQTRREKAREPEQSARCRTGQDR